jgi:hypothetical protein
MTAGAPGLAGAWIAVLLVAAGVPAGGPPVSRLPPEYYARIRGPRAGESGLEVTGRVQHARPESLDLVRRLPRAAPLLRLETWIGAEGVVLQPRAPVPERYRAPVPRGVPLSWGYELHLVTAADLPQVTGHDYWCSWLGGVLLEPRVPAPVDSAAASRILLGLGSPSGGGEYGPWPRADGLFRPQSLDDLADAFVAVGNWRVRERAVGACTLQVALAGSLGVADDVWLERLGRELATLTPPAGPVLICVAPAAGPPVVYRARRSWLVLWPESQSTLPAAPLLPGRSPLGDTEPRPADPRSGALERRAPRDERPHDRQAEGAREAVHERLDERLEWRLGAEEIAQRHGVAVQLVSHAGGDLRVALRIEQELDEPLVRRPEEQRTMLQEGAGGAPLRAAEHLASVHEQLRAAG